jgi:hypothetical protein
MKHRAKGFAWINGGGLGKARLNDRAQVATSIWRHGELWKSPGIRSPGTASSAAAGDEKS